MRLWKKYSKADTFWLKPTGLVLKPAGKTVEPTPDGLLYPDAHQFGLTSVWFGSSGSCSRSCVALYKG